MRRSTIAGEPFAVVRRLCAVALLVAWAVGVVGAGALLLAGGLDGLVDRALAQPGGDGREGHAPPGAGASSRTLDALGDGLEQAAVSMLAASIVGIRDDAVARGVSPLPAEVRAAFAGFLPAALLDAVRWRVVEPDGLSLPGGVLSLGDRPALTAGHVIVFAEAADLERPLVWAHELHHARQYDEWGIEGFARRYLADSGAVEHAANEFVWRWRDAGGDLAPTQ